MELDDADNEELLKFETVQTAATKDIEFDKIKLSDVIIPMWVFLDGSQEWIQKDPCA